MGFRRFFFLIVPLLFGHFAISGESPSELVLKRSLGKHQEERAIVYPYARGFRVDFMAFERGHLPVPKGHRDFESKALALEFLRRNDFKRTAMGKEASSPLFLTEVPGPRTQAVIWPTKENWSFDWEVQYGQWISSQVDVGFLAKHGVATDCADVAVSLRWIFSRIHGLPVGQRLAGSNILFTNESMRWDWVSLPTALNWWEDQLFMTALDYVLDSTYTHSIISDSYPVEISPTVFLPGVHHLNLYNEETGHTMMVNQLDQILGVSLFYSDVPRAVRTLYSESFYQYSQFSDFSRGGLLRFLWVEKDASGRWAQLKKQDMPGYSEMQYEPGFMIGSSTFHEAVARHLGFPTDPLTQYNNAKAALLDLIERRIKIVEDGFAACQVEDCQPGTPAYEVWSTPSRDGRIRALIHHIEDLSWYDPAVDSDWDLLQRSRTLFILNGAHWLSEIVSAFKYGEPSSDPRDPVAARWGF